MLGHSGATIDILPDGKVRKLGGSMDLYSQAVLCTEIGHAVCPDIFKVGPGMCYTMEQLQPIDPEANNMHKWLTMRIHALLRGHVWTKKAWKAQGNWSAEVEEWILIHSEHHDLLQRAFYHAYGAGAPPTYVLTHGDPTLANAMKRKDNSIVLIDPAPPRPGVPMLREVDEGKLLQSAAGWETIISEGSWPLPPTTLIKDILTVVENKPAALFWAAFHCARVAARGKRQAIVTWGNEKSRMFAEMACSTLSI